MDVFCAILDCALGGSPPLLTQHCGVLCRTLRYLGLANNRITVHACTVLAAGMRVSRALDRVNLDSNPLGLDGAASIVESLARRHVSSVSLNNCNFGTTSGGEAQTIGGGNVKVSRFDIRRPNRVYRCDHHQCSAVPAGLYIWRPANIPNEP